jgi:transposase
MRWTRKRLQKIPVERNSDRVVDLRRSYCEIISNVPSDSLIFLDETGFNLHTSYNYGYSPAGQPAVIGLPANRGRNLSLITTISMYGLVSYAIIDGPVNGDVFSSYLEIDMLPRLQKRIPTVVMDNARIHHVAKVSKWATDNGIQIQYLPPYSPQLNPVENLYASIKMKLNNTRPHPSSTEELRLILNSILDAIVDVDFSNYFNKMRSWIDKGQRNEPFI